ncbi:MAG: hypothetical protein ACMVO3_22890 [Thalassobaculum sp.]
MATAKPAKTSSGAAASTGSRRSRPTATRRGPTDQVKESALDLWADAERCARYHGARAAYFEAIHRWSMFLVFVTGSAATVNLAADLLPGTALAIMVTAVPAVLAAAETAFNFSGAAREHLALRGRFVDLAARIDVASEDPEDLAEWQRAIYDIYKDEPARTYFALNALCHNAVAQVIRAPAGSYQEVHWLRAALRHVWASSPSRHPRRDSVA